MSKDNKREQIGAIEWFFVVFFFVIIGLAFWSVYVQADVVTGYMFPIGLIIVVIYFGIRYLFEQGKMLKAIKEFQKNDL
jgi:hypothetical protein